MMQNSNLFLSKDQITFLKWLAAQEEPRSISFMEEHQAPCYTYERLESLRRSGYILREIGVDEDGTCGIYSASDLAHAALQMLDQEHQDRADAKSQQGFENKVSVANVLMPLITFFLGLIVEHYSGIVGIVASLFTH